MKANVILTLLMVSGVACGQSVGDEALIARQNKNAAILESLTDQEPIYQENVI